MRLLLAEDDALLGEGLVRGLGFNGYSVEWMKTAADAAEASTSGEFDLAILDIGLPDGSGLAVLQAIRGGPNAAMPVLILTARDDPRSVVSALDTGADDYLAKPFDLPVLLARLRAISRRRSATTDTVLRSRDLQLNLATRELRRGAAVHTPTAAEMKLLTLLMQRPGKLVGKDRIEEELYGWSGEVDSNTVEVLVYGLRKKLGKDTILTMRGVGYMVPA